MTGAILDPRMIFMLPVKSPNSLFTFRAILRRQAQWLWNEPCPSIPWTRYSSGPLQPQLNRINSIPQTRAFDSNVILHPLPLWNHIKVWIIVFKTHLDLAGCGDTQTSDVKVLLYQFGEPGEIVEYNATSDGSLTRCHFDPHGIRFGASDTRGDLHLWKFEANLSSRKPLVTLKSCHTAAINDFAFLNSSTVIATAGLSINKM